MNESSFSSFFSTLITLSVCALCDHLKKKKKEPHRGLKMFGDDDDDKAETPSYFSCFDEGGRNSSILVFGPERTNLRQKVRLIKVNPSRRSDGSMQFCRTIAVENNRGWDDQLLKDIVINRNDATNIIGSPSKTSIQCGNADLISSVTFQYLDPPEIPSGSVFEPFLSDIPDAVKEDVLLAIEIFFSRNMTAWNQVSPEIAELVENVDVGSGLFWLKKLVLGRDKVCSLSIWGKVKCIGFGAPFPHESQESNVSAISLTPSADLCCVSKFESEKTIECYDTSASLKFNATLEIAISDLESSNVHSCALLDSGSIQCFDLDSSTRWPTQVEEQAFLEQGEFSALSLGRDSLCVIANNTKDLTCVGARAPGSENIRLDTVTIIPLENSALDAWCGVIDGLVVCSENYPARPFDVESEWAFVSGGYPEIVCGASRLNPNGEFIFPTELFVFGGVILSFATLAAFLACILHARRRGGREKSVQVATVFENTSLSSQNISGEISSTPENILRAIFLIRILYHAFETLQSIVNVVDMTSGLLDPALITSEQQGLQIGVEILVYVSLGVCYGGLLMTIRYLGTSKLASSKFRVAAGFLTHNPELVYAKKHQTWRLVTFIVMLGILFDCLVAIEATFRTGSCEDSFFARSAVVTAPITGLAFLGYCENARVYRNSHYALARAYTKELVLVTATSFAMCGIILWSFYMVDAIDFRIGYWVPSSLGLFVVPVVFVWPCFGRIQSPHNRAFAFMISIWWSIFGILSLNLYLAFRIGDEEIGGQDTIFNVARSGIGAKQQNRCVSLVRVNIVLLILCASTVTISVAGFLVYRYLKRVQVVGFAHHSAHMANANVKCSRQSHSFKFSKNLL